MSQVSFQSQSPSLFETQNLSNSPAIKQHKNQQKLNNQQEVGKFSKVINYAALGIDTHKYNQAALNALKSSPAAIKALANYQLNRLKKAQTKEKEIKTEKWKSLTKSGKMTEVEYENAIQGMKDSHSEEFKQTKKELEDILETVQKNRNVKEGEIVKTYGLDSKETTKNIEKLDKIDEATVKKFTKDLPSLDEKPKKSFFKRLFSKSGLAVLATALVGAAAVALGVIALPAVGILAAVGITAALAVPSIYSTVSSFIAICNPKTKATLENIDDIRQATSGTPTELNAHARQVGKDRHEEIIKTIDETRNKSVNGTNTDDFLTTWRKNHPEVKKDAQTINVANDQVQLIDPDIFGLKIKKKDLEKLSCSPNAITEFSNHTIAKQIKLDEKELSVLTRKLDGLVAVGEKTEAEKKEILDRCKERQQKNLDTLATKLSETIDTVTRNRNLVQAKDLDTSEAIGSKTSFEELLRVREETDKNLIEKYTKELPDLDSDKKKSSFFKRLFSWSGAKMVTSAILAGLAITAAVLVPPLGIAATLGLAVSAAASTYSTISSFVAICNPKTKDVLQDIEDIRNGINGRPTELSKLARETEKARHEEIISALTQNTIKNTEQVLNRLTNSLDKAKTEKNAAVVDELTVVQKSVKTVLDAEKKVQNIKKQSANDIDFREINFETLGVNTSKYNEEALGNLKNSPKAVQELATYQIKSLTKTHERESKIKIATWETLVQTGKMSREEYEKNISELRTTHETEMEKTKKELEGMVKTAENNRLKLEGSIVNKFGTDSVQTDKQIVKLDKLEEKIVKKFTKDLPSLDEKPKKSILRKIFSKKVLAIVATAVVGAAAIALTVGALPAIGILGAIGLTAAAAKKIAAKTLYSSVSSAIAIANPKTKATLEQIDDLRKAEGGAPTELSGVARTAAADRHAEILKTIDDMKNASGTDTDFLTLWKTNHPEIKKSNKILDPENDTITLIDTKLLGLEKVNKKNIKALCSSPEAVQQLANYEIAKQQKLHEKELTILSRRLDSLVANGNKTAEEREEILNNCITRQTQEMDELCTHLSSTLDTVRNNRDLLVAQDLADSEKIDSKKTFEELREIRKKQDDDLIKKFCTDLPNLDEDKKKSTFFKRLFSWSGAKMLVSAALAAITIATLVLVPPLGIATAAGLGLAAFAASNSYSAISSFVAISNPKTKNVLQYIEDIRNGFKGRPTRLTEMTTETVAERHEEVLNHLKGKKPEYQEDFFTPENMQKNIDNMLIKAEKEGDVKRTSSLSLLKQTLKTIVSAEKVGNEVNDEKDLLLTQMQLQVPV